MNTFDEVAKRYNAIRPVRGVKASHDIRPLGKRRQQWLRIAKVSDSCYALSDGWHPGDAAFTAYLVKLIHHVPTQEDLVAHSPIVWRRLPDGRETVTLRNAGRHESTVSTRHSFLRKYLPRGISIPYRSNNNGKHFLIVGGESVFFPMAKSLPKAVYDHNNAPVRKFMLNKCVRGDDGSSLMFQRVGEGWELIGDKPLVPMRRINKTEKAPYAAACREFREWATIMLPVVVVPTRSAQYWDQVREANKRLMAASGGDKPSILARQIIADPEHDLRVDLAIQLYSISFGSDMQGILKGLTRDINKVCDFHTIEGVKK